MITAIVTILIFLLLISLHEFGHFIFSKMTGVSVLEFSIGMGPAIFKKQKGETLYSLRILPIGGYCKLDGENEESDNPHAFSNQKWWKRFIVISAGAILNLILGFVLIIIMTVSAPKNADNKNMINLPVIDSVVKNSYLSESGIQVGDKLEKINDKSIRVYDDIYLASVDFEEDKEVNIIVDRNSKKLRFSVKPSKIEYIYKYFDDYCEITENINGVTTTKKANYNEEAKEQVKELIGKTQTESKLILGFTPKSEEVSYKNIIPYSFNYTIYIVRMVYNSLFDLITGKSNFSELSGPVGIVTAVNSAVNTGKYKIQNVLFLTALLSVNLGVVNLLPLPALDGGRLFFLLIELVRRKPVPQDKEAMVHAIGLMLLLGLTVIISYNDIVKLIK